MADQYPVIILLAPLAGSILIALFASRKELALPITLTSMVISTFAAIGTFHTVISSEAKQLTYVLGGWTRLSSGIAPGIEFRVDAISGLVVIIVAVIGLINAVYASSRVKAEIGAKEPYYYILYLLLLTGLAGMTITNDAFNLYVLLEISSLTSYALIAIGPRRAALSSYNYVIMGTVGASFYLLGVGYLYMKTGSLNMDDIRSFLAANDGIENSSTIKIAFMMIVLGLWTKMALFPLHGWLPNAYAYAPTATGTLMAPLVTKVMIYIMIRMLMSVFGFEYVFETLNWSNTVLTIAIIAIVMGSLYALARQDLKKMLTFLIIAEVGYMVGGVWLANYEGMVGAVYHIISDATMTFCLFLAAGIVVLRTGNPRLTAFRGFFREHPLTMTCFTVGALSMIGLPPTCGFFSKWYLVQGGILAGMNGTHMAWGYVAALLFSSLVNAILFFRIFEMAFFGKLKDESEPTADPDPDAQPDSLLEKTPGSMFMPLVLAAFAVIAVGLFNNQITVWIGTALEGLPK